MTVEKVSQGNKEPPFGLLCSPLSPALRGTARGNVWDIAPLLARAEHSSRPRQKYNRFKKFPINSCNFISTVILSRRYDSSNNM